MKYTKKHKKVVLISIILVIVTSMFLVMHNSHAYKELPKVKLKGDINKSGLAIMVESDYQTGEYQKLDSNTFPTDGFILNRIKSGCVDKNGKDVDALTYNENDKTISIKTKQSVYCYLYYDNLFKGLGTEEEPYQINYIEDLVRLSNSVNKDLNTYANKNFILTRDLDFNENESYMKYNDTGFGDINGVNNIEGIKDELTNIDGSGFIPIGNLATHFQGNLDGNNKRLDTIFERNKNEVGKHLGLFGVIENSIIKDLSISGTIKTDMTFIDIGGIAGESYDNISILSCITDVEVTGVNYSTGGIIGANLGNVTIKDSINKGNITNGINVGGLVGAIETRENTSITIENSRNEGKITNELGENAGGLLGRDSSKNKDKLSVIIKNSYNAGEVTNSKESEGGLVGLVYGAIEIDNSHNEGKISNTLGTNLGGLIGFGTDTSNIIINNSYNKSPISSNTAEELDVNMGGLVGLLNGQTNIKNSYNEGNIENLRTDYAIGSFTGKGIIEGGIIGKVNNNFKSYIIDSYNTGNLSNGNGSGGIIGIEYSKEILIINRCYNKGKIVALLRSGFSGTQAGGIIGSDNSSNNTYILNSYNTGSLESIYEAGGLIGEVYEGSSGKYCIINSYNLGNASSDRSTGGIFNQYYSSTTHNAGMYYVNNVYNIGTIGGNSSIKQSIGYLNNTVDRTIRNAYYLENTAPTGTNLENDSELTTSMTETDMKNITFVDTLNKNVDELNNAGLETIDENLKNYELEKWGLAVNGTKIPVLTKKIEDLSGKGNHGLSYAAKYDSDGVTTSTDSTHNGYVYAGLENHNFENKFTMVLKFRMNKFYEGENNLFGNWETGGMGIDIQKQNNNMSLVASVYTDKYYGFNKNYDFKENEWYTIVLTYDGTLTSDNLKAYINGELYDSTNVVGNVRMPGNVPIVLGGNPAYNYSTTNTVYTSMSYATYKEALIFDRALTEEKDHISTNYKDDINVENQDELLLWYKF